MQERILTIIVLFLASIFSSGTLPTSGQEICSEPIAGSQKPAPQLYMFDFYSSWSAPSTALRPTITKAEQRFAGKVKVIHIDVDDHQNRPFVEQVGVVALPTLIVVNKDGDQLKRLVGSAEGTAVEILLETLLPNSSGTVDASTEMAEASTHPVILAKQEVRLDPGP